MTTLFSGLHFPFISCPIALQRPWETSIRIEDREMFDAQELMIVLGKGLELAGFVGLVPFVNGLTVNRWNSQVMKATDRPNLAT